MSLTVSIIDIVLCCITAAVGIYYLWRNRDNGSQLRTVMAILLGAFACDTLYSLYVLISQDQHRSVTIIAVHAACAGLFYYLAYRPGHCEYPAVHHLGSVRRCVVVQKNKTPQHQAMI